MLEILGTTEGHVIDCNNIVTWQFLQARTRTHEDNCTEMISLLAEVGAIDADLWENKYIWSDNFVERIASVYLNRKSKAPEKPVSTRITTNRNPANGRISTGENPQTKLKETKLKETKEKEFLSFWNLYPSRNGKKVEKGVCLKMFKDLKNDDLPKIIDAVKNYSCSRQVQAGIGIRDPKRFLRNDFWKDWIVPETIVPGNLKEKTQYELDVEAGK